MVLLSHPVLTPPDPPSVNPPSPPPSRPPIHQPTRNPAVVYVCITIKCIRRSLLHTGIARLTQWEMSFGRVDGRQLRDNETTNPLFLHLSD